MRWLGDIACFFAAAAVAAGIGRIYYDHAQEELQTEKTRLAVHRIERELAVRVATKTAELTSRGYPATIDPSWFAGESPVNALLDDHRPWIEVASADQADLEHPPMRIAMGEAAPSMWYNPYRGIIRARVPTTVSDDRALSLYNRINATDLKTIFFREPPVVHIESAPASTTSEIASSSTKQEHDMSKKPRSKQRRGGHQPPLVVVHTKPAPPIATAPSPE